MDLRKSWFVFLCLVCLQVFALTLIEVVDSLDQVVVLSSLTSHFLALCSSAEHFGKIFHYSSSIIPSKMVLPLQNITQV